MHIRTNIQWVLNPFEIAFCEGGAVLLSKTGAEMDRNEIDPALTLRKKTRQGTNEKKSKIKEPEFFKNYHLYQLAVATS